jgi:putative FmdB family regulatory protein
MPSYDYECTNCGISFELDQRISDPPQETCPECQGRLIRVISGGGGVILKGKGFYATDYRSESYKKAASSENPPAASGKGDGGDKSGE